MESTTATEIIEFDGTIEITDLLRKYFTPIPQEIDASKVILRPGVNVEEYLKKREEAINKSRTVFYQLEVLRIHTELEEAIYHKDYDYIEYSSKVLFKRPSKDLSSEETHVLNEFIENLFSIVILFKEDYWDKYFSNFEDFRNYQQESDCIEEVKDILNILKMRDDLPNSEFVLRRRDSKYGTVNIDETTQVNEVFKETMFEYYAQVKYQNFLHRFNLSRFLKPDEASLNIPISEYTNLPEFDRLVTDCSFILEFKGITPSCTTTYFQQLVDVLIQSTSFHGKLSPLYEFDKLVVKAMNAFIEDHSHEKLKKKDKHFLLFSMLRVFKLVPNRLSLQLSGTEDAKEDFIKQIIR